MSTTREQWLLHAVEFIRNEFPDVSIPRVNVSCSWPGGGSPAKRIGECWPAKASKAGINELFISPKLEDPQRVLGILTHELAHAVDDCAHGHRAPFTKIARALGCEGKATQMVPPESITSAWVVRMVNAHGKYPHRVLDKSQSGQKKQATRMLKAECMDCESVWRMSAKHMAGVTMCPVCGGSDLVLDGTPLTADDEEDGE